MSEPDIRLIMASGALGAEDNYLLDAVIRAVAESHAQEGEWAEKYGVNVETDKFMMHKYCWCDQDDCPWCWDEQERGERAPNFHYKPTGLKVEWYKYIGRDMEISHPVSLKECRDILNDCLKV